MTKLCPQLQERQSCNRNLVPFHAVDGNIQPTDVQHLMAHPFFSLSKTRRTRPIDYRSGKITIRVEGVEGYGMATIWDADILIWASSLISDALKRKRATSRLILTTPYQILGFIGRRTSARDYLRLKAALDRLQSTTVITSIRQKAGARNHRFSWISEWRELLDAANQPVGIEITLSDWFYQLALDKSAILTLDRNYFALTGGLERWLYRLVRKHGGKQQAGWRFDLVHLYRKSASLSVHRRFAFELKQIVKRQPLPGYQLGIKTDPKSEISWLVFKPLPACGKPVGGVVLSGTQTIVLSGTPLSCHQERKPPLRYGNKIDNRPLNIDSNIESNLCARARSVEKLAIDTANAMRAFPQTRKGNSHG